MSVGTYSAKNLIGSSRDIEVNNARPRKVLRNQRWYTARRQGNSYQEGQGIGSQMIEYYCNHVDGLGMAAYHETDRLGNVKLYERFGFKVSGEESIMDFPNWYMWRPPSGGA